MTAWPFQPAPLRVARRLASPRGPEDEAGERWVIAPGETQMTRPALHLPDDPQRVTALLDETTLAQEDLRVRGGRVDHLPTTACRLREAVLHRGHLYGGWRLHGQLSPRSESWVAPPWLEREPGEHLLASSFVGNRYFGHYLADDLVAARLGEGIGPVVQTDDPRTLQQQDYAQALGLSLRPVASARFERLVVVDDRGLNAHRRGRHQAVRHRLLRGRAATSARGVWLRRGERAGRQLLNEPEVEAALLARGFIALDPAQQPLDVLLDRLADARIAIGMEGSQMAHAVHTVRPGGALVCLMPPDRFNNLFKAYADAMDLLYAFTLCEAAPGGYRMNLDRLQRLLDLVDHHIA